MTVTVNVAVYGVPELSVAVTVTVVVPIGNAVPDGGKDESEATPSLSLAVGAYVTTAVGKPAGR